MEHEITRKIANRMDESSKVYLKTGDAAQLIVDITEYINHVMQHLWKENNRLFMMADMALQDKIEEVNQSLNEVEKSRLKEIGKSREDNEELADDLDKKISVI
jgi:hemerythrin-like domain-containing protein